MPRLFPADTFDVFKIASYRRLWTAAVFFAMGQWLERTIVGWLVLEITGSPFLTGLAWAIRFSPNLILGPVLGVISDRYARHRTLSINALVRAISMLVVAGVFFVDESSVFPLFVLALISGTSTTLQMAVIQPLAIDVVGEDRLSRGITITSLGQRLVGAGGAISGGLLLATIPHQWIFVIGSFPLVVAAAYFSSINPQVRKTQTRSSFVSDLVEGVLMMKKNKVVLALIGLMAFAEMFGFSYHGFLPVVADELLSIGPEGLGVLVSATAIGGLVGMLLITLYGRYARKGVLLLVTVGCLGVSEILLGTSSIFFASLIILVCLGAAGAMIDSLEWILLQGAVPKDMRGRVLGGWNLAIGCGWIGTLLMGLMAEQFGISVTFWVAGLILVLVASLSPTAVKELKELR